MRPIWEPQQVGYWPSFCLSHQHANKRPGLEPTCLCITFNVLKILCSMGFSNWYSMRTLLKWGVSCVFDLLSFAPLSDSGTHVWGMETDGSRQEPRGEGWWLLLPCALFSLSLSARPSSRVSLSDFLSQDCVATLLPRVFLGEGLCLSTQAWTLCLHVSSENYSRVKSVVKSEVLDNCCLSAWNALVNYRCCPCS